MVNTAVSSDCEQLQLVLQTELVMLTQVLDAPEAFIGRLIVS